MVESGVVDRWEALLVIDWFQWRGAEAKVLEVTESWRVENGDAVWVAILVTSRTAISSWHSIILSLTKRCPNIRAL